MYAQERQQAIADEVHLHGRASVAALADTYAVTSETVRRDLAILERGGHLHRVHGGAVAADTLRVIERGVAERSTSFSDEKDRIATAATRFLPRSGGSIVIDAGTTTVAAAARIPHDRATTVFTHSLQVATAVADNRGTTLQLIGGRIRGLTQAAVGPVTLAALTPLHADVAFIGTNGVSLDHGLSTPDIDEGSVKSAIVAAAKRVVVLTDSSKFHQTHLVSFADLQHIHVLITDDGIDPDYVTALSTHGIEVVIA